MSVFCFLVINVAAIVIAFVDFNCFYVRQRTSIRGSVRWLVGWLSVGVSVTHFFDKHVFHTVHILAYLT